MLKNVTMVANDLEMYQGGGGACGNKEDRRFQSASVSSTILVKSMTVGGVRK